MLLEQPFVAVPKPKLYPYGAGAGDVESPKVDDSCAVHYDVNLPIFNRQLSPVYVSWFVKQM